MQNRITPPRSPRLRHFLGLFGCDAAEIVPHGDIFLRKSVRPAQRPHGDIMRRPLANAGQRDKLPDQGYVTRQRDRVTTTLAWLVYSLGIPQSDVGIASAGGAAGFGLALSGGVGTFCGAGCCAWTESDIAVTNSAAMTVAASVAGVG